MADNTLAPSDRSALLILLGAGIAWFFIDRSIGRQRKGRRK